MNEVTIKVEEDGKITFATSMSLPELNLLLDVVKGMIITGEATLEDPPQEG